MTTNIHYNATKIIRSTVRGAEQNFQLFYRLHKKYVIIANNNSLCCVCWVWCVCRVCYILRELCELCELIVSCCVLLMLHVGYVAILCSMLHMLCVKFTNKNAIFIEYYVCRSRCGVWVRAVGRSGGIDIHLKIKIK